MREWFLRAPAWASIAVHGSAYGLVGALYASLRLDVDSTRGIVWGGVAGALIGVVTGLVQYSRNRGLRELAARSPEGLSHRVRRAAWRGPMPEAPAIRQAAHGLVVVRLEREEGWRRNFGRVVLLLCALVVVVLVIAHSAWWCLAAAACLGLAVLDEGHLRRLHRREELLVDGASSGRV